MPTMLRRDPVSIVRAAVKLWNHRLAPGLFGLACSGGADSMALTDAAIAECGPSNVIVIHVDHGLSPGSSRVAAEVTAWARAQGVATIVRNASVERRASLEAAARDARYAALEAVASEVGCGWIWLAHTARDQAETVLMRIVRGTGPAGLAGMATIRGRFLRPLIDTPRATIDDYVAVRGLPTWEDPMNADTRIARVRFRNTHLPALRAENPALDAALCRLAYSAREWMAAIDELAEPHGRFPIACRVLLELASAVRKRAYALALEHAGLGYDAVHLEQIDQLLLRMQDGQHAVDVPGARVVRTYDVMTLERPGERISEPQPMVAPAGYELRPWRPGDRMKPARLKGRSRKLSDLFIDAKIPRDVRRVARVLVRTQDQVIVWADHVGLAYGESDDVMPRTDRRSRNF